MDLADVVYKLNIKESLDLADVMYQRIAELNRITGKVKIKFK